MASRYGRKKRRKHLEMIATLAREAARFQAENRILAERAIEHARAYSSLAGVRCQADGDDWVYAISLTAARHAVETGTVPYLVAQIAERFGERMLAEVK